MWLSVVVAGCATAGEAEDVGASVAPLDDSARVLERRGGRALVAGDAEIGPDGTDIRLPRPMAVRDGLGYREAPDAVHAGALLDDGAVWVTHDGDLVLDRHGVLETLARDVIPEIDVAPDGRRVAFARRPGEDAGVFLVDVERPGQPRRVTPGLAVADRPLFVDDRLLIVVGARAGGIAGVWLVRHDSRDPQPRPLTNAGLAVGRLGPSFVPPPASHESMRVVGDELEYHDGEQTRRVSLETGS